MFLFNLNVNEIHNFNQLLSNASQKSSWVDEFLEQVSMFVYLLCTIKNFPLFMPPLFFYFLVFSPSRLTARFFQVHWVLPGTWFSACTLLSSACSLVCSSNSWLDVRPLFPILTCHEIFFFHPFSVSSISCGMIVSLINPQQARWKDLLPVDDCSRADTHSFEMSSWKPKEGLGVNYNWCVWVRFGQNEHGWQSGYWFLLHLLLLRCPKDLKVSTDLCRRCSILVPPTNQS